MDEQFTATLSTLHEGQAVRELNDALRGLVQSIQIVGKPGSINLKLTLSPCDDDVAGCRISYQVNAKAPKIDPKPVYFFITDEGLLTRELPIERQNRLPGTE